MDIRGGLLGWIASHSRSRFQEKKVHPYALHLHTLAAHKRDSYGKGYVRKITLIELPPLITTYGGGCEDGAALTCLLMKQYIHGKLIY